MSINIKEIFQSDNLSVSQDKINYNFDQILANGGGPQGLKGDKGTTGAIGSIGPKGDKGEVGGTGLKGNTGADGYFTLKSYDDPIDQHTLLPKTQPTGTSTVGERPTNLVLGRSADSTYTDLTDKSALLTLVDEANGANFTDLIRLRLKAGAGAFNATTGIVRMINGTGGARLKIATLGGTNELEIQAGSILLNDGGGNTKLKITGGATEATGDWNFIGSAINLNSASSFTNNGVTSLLNNNTIGALTKFNNIIGGTNVTGEFLKINTNGSLPALNKILVAQDAVGTVAWKSPYEVNGIYPIGSIVFVNPTDIVETYFAINTWQTTGSVTNPSWSFFGRGKSGSRWAGWYLLMGQTNRWDITSTLHTYVPTNVPGSILMGASAPDDKISATSDFFESSMAQKRFNPVSPSGQANGYGANYQPELRGNYNGNSNNTIMNYPKDLLRVTDNLGVYSAVLDTNSVIPMDAASSGTPAKVLYTTEFPFMPLPMAIYLGRTDLVYDYSAGVGGSGSPTGEGTGTGSGGTPGFALAFAVSGNTTANSNQEAAQTGTITVNSAPVTVTFSADVNNGFAEGVATSTASLSFTGGTVTGGNISVSRSSNTAAGTVTRTLTQNTVYSYSLSTSINSGSAGAYAEASFTVAAAG